MGAQGGGATCNHNCGARLVATDRERHRRGSTSVAVDPSALKGVEMALETLTQRQAVCKKVQCPNSPAVN
ncbi:MAG: hypothetical protein Cons2KO_03910 [Congregibacter sp.]